MMFGPFVLAKINPIAAVISDSWAVNQAVNHELVNIVGN